MLLFVALALVAAASALPSEIQYQTSFLQFQKQFGKVYSATEMRARYAAFKSNSDFVAAHNARFAAGLETYDVEMNQVCQYCVVY
jgi:hypothetical protein